MARISVKALHGRYWVTIRGHLSERDLRRLEWVCGPALEQARAPLTLRLAVNGMDEAAHAYVDRLADRGAEVVFD